MPGLPRASDVRIASGRPDGIVRVRYKSPNAGRTEAYRTRPKYYIPGFEFSSYRKPHFNSELVFSPSSLGFTPTLQNFFTRPLPASLSLPPPSPAGLLSLELLEFCPYFSPISPELEPLNWCIKTSLFVPVSESLLVLCVHWGQLAHAVHKAALS